MHAFTAESGIVLCSFKFFNNPNNENSQINHAYGLILRKSNPYYFYGEYEINAQTLSYHSLRCIFLIR
jgi:hypothetical protein